MKIQINFGDTTLTGESAVELLAKARPILTQKQKQLSEVEKKYKALKKEATQLEKEVKQLEAANQPQADKPKQQQ